MCGSLEVKRRRIVVSLDGAGRSGKLGLGLGRLRCLPHLSPRCLHLRVLACTRGLDFDHSQEDTHSRAPAHGSRYKPMYL